MLAIGITALTSVAFQHTNIGRAQKKKVGDLLKGKIIAQHVDLQGNPI